MEVGVEGRGVVLTTGEMEIDAATSDLSRISSLLTSGAVGGTGSAFAVGAGNGAAAVMKLMLLLEGRLTPGATLTERDSSGGDGEGSRPIGNERDIEFKGEAIASPLSATDGDERRRLATGAEDVDFSGLGGAFRLRALPAAVTDIEAADDVDGEAGAGSDPLRELPINARLAVFSGFFRAGFVAVFALAEPEDEPVVAVGKQEGKSSPRCPSSTPRAFAPAADARGSIQSEAKSATVIPGGTCAPGGAG